MSTELKTPAEWCEELGARIVDPDGWREHDAPPWHQPISRAEFDRRLIRCTIDGRGYPDFWTPTPATSATDTTGAGA